MPRKLISLLWVAAKANYIGILFTLAVVAGVLDTYSWELFLERPDGGEESKKYGITIIHWITFCVSAAGIFLIAARLKNQALQRTDDRFNAAVQILGSSETSARTGAIYSLYHLALDNAKYRVQIAQILCSHIRSKTREDAYQMENRMNPSNEIQTTVNLLFKNIPGQEGLYCKFGLDLPRAMLSYAYLVGADFYKAHCRGVNFRRAHCEGVSFMEAHCENAIFGWAYCKETNFSLAYCQGATFMSAHCEGANFRETHCEGVYFTSAHCEGADFTSAYCQGARFTMAHCEGANFKEAHCEGAGFASTNCVGANFSKAYCQGVEFSYTSCEGVNFSQAHCQGVIFYNVNCEGAYAKSNAGSQKLVDRAGKNTEIQDVVISGQFDRNSVNGIEMLKKDAEGLMLEDWYLKMQKLIYENKGKPIVHGKPKGIIEGVLGDSEKLRVLCRKLEEIEKLKWQRYE